MILCLKRWRLVSLHAVFRNLVAPVITSGETTWGYRELHVSRKLEHGPRHYTNVSEVNQPKLTAPTKTLKRIWPRSPLAAGRTKSLFGFYSLDLGGFFTNAFSSSFADPPRLAG